MSTGRAHELDRARRLLAELRRRQRAAPLAYAECWHREEPHTSQLRALRLATTPGALHLNVFGGNKTGKSEVLAMWLAANALGRDYTLTERRGLVRPVQAWLARNGLPESMIPGPPAIVWVGSPAFGPACEQIRPKLRRYLPPDTRYIRWDQPNEAEARTSNGGKVTSKAYKQFDQDGQTWEGAAPRVIGLDEQPNSFDNLLAAYSRLLESDVRGSVKLMMALTGLRGKSDWCYRELVAKTDPAVVNVWLHGSDNPHIDQAEREALLARFPAWQRAARDRGEFTQPEGAIFTALDRGAHLVERCDWPRHWVRWWSADWGPNSPHGLWAVEVGEDYTLPSGRVLLSGDLVVYREVAPRRDLTQPAIPDRAFLRMCQDAERGDAWVDERGRERAPECYRVGDSGNPGNEAAILEAADLGWMVARAEKPAGSIAHGLDLISTLLATVDPADMVTPCRPRLYFTADVPVLLGELEGMLWGPEIAGQEPRPDPRCPDHGPDALRYLLRYRLHCGVR